MIKELTPWSKSLSFFPYPLQEWKTFLAGKTRPKPPEGWHYLAGPFNKSETMELIHIAIEMVRGEIDFCIVEDRYGNRQLHRTDEGWLRGDLHFQIDQDED